MKNYIKILSCFVLFNFLAYNNGTAQNIPDANFALYIQSLCPLCLDANNNLTAAAASVTSLDVSSADIRNLTGIEGFTNLQQLNCSYNPLRSLPTLPNNLVALDCSYTQLSSISNLPNSLEYLDCSYSLLTSLSNLPANLQKLYCSVNGLTSLPPLPSSLKEFQCAFNSITSLPTLPSSLEIFDCIYNSLTNLPDLPNSLTILYCYNNQITSLPTLPASLVQLQCQNNLLTSLPVLPANFKVLFCENNQLTNLPNLPTGMTFISCHNNLIECLPTLPNSLTYLRIDADKILCLPNEVANLGIGTASGEAILLTTCAPTIVTHPSLNPICSGTNQLLTAKATGVGAMTAKWQRRGATEVNFTDITGALAYTSNTDTPYNFTPSLADDGASYRVVFTSTTPACSGESATNAGVLSVSDANGTGFVIPNANFMAAVKAACPTCIDACNKLTSVASQLESLDISNKNLTDLTGIDKFLSLKQLNLSNNQLINLPTLPPTLQVLNCQNNRIPSLSNLPSTLQVLNCANNQISSFSNLPANLQMLNCANNFLANLPDLPSGLMHLNYSFNLIRCLPTLPNSLQEMIVNQTQTQCLPNPIANLTIRNPSNSIISLPLCTPNIMVHPVVSSPVCPNIPITLTANAEGPNDMAIVWQRKRPTDAKFSNIPGTYVYYGANTTSTFQFTPTTASNGEIYRAVFTTNCNNQSISNAAIITLATVTGFQVPDVHFAEAIRSACPTCITDCNALTNGAATLVSIDVSSKNITNLSGLEYFANLRTLNCSNNNINILPSLPAFLRQLYCHGNNIVCLPTLPDDVLILQLDNTKVSCLPNAPSNLTVLNPTGTAISIPSCPTIIVSQPSLPSVVCTFRSLSLIAKATSSVEGMSVRWQRKAASATDFSNIDNTLSNYITNTDATYTFTPTAADEGAQFRAVFTVCNGETPTNPVTITLTPSDIPDRNFANAIRSVCPNCIDACNNLTEDAESLTSLSIPNRFITDLTGISKFVSLQVLDIYANRLTTLPTLPTTLRELECGGNQLTIISSLPNGLQKLFCQFNQLTSLPTLPNNLQWLYCQNNQLTGLPSLPLSLSNLYCNNNQITSLPALQTGLINLYCHDNLLSSLPALPGFLQAIDCQNNQIYCLPTLPSSLRVLYVDPEKVTCLPNSVSLALFNGNPTVCNFSISQHPTVPSLVCKDRPLTLTAVATNGGFTTIKWQQRPFGAANFTDIVGSERIYIANANATYTFTPTATDASLQIRAVFTSACSGTLITDIIKLDIAEGTYIPDANFAEAIRLACPTCINACNILTAVAASLTSLNVSSSKIEDLTGIEGFVNLQTLNCVSNNLTNLPNLPTRLTSLRIADNEIYCLPTLPSSLLTFIYDVNKIFCLPNVPPGLTTNLPACGIVIQPYLASTPVPGETFNLTAKALISGVSTAKWQRKGALESNFSDISGSSTAYSSNSIFTYRINSLSATDMGASFRAVFSSSCAASMTSDFVVLASALPVELVSFKGTTEGGKNYLFWQTAVEAGTNNFEIERSITNKSFTKIGEIIAKGSNETYSFIDDAPTGGINYYRLKINDIDGKTDYSNIISIQSKAKSALKIYPSVTSDFLTVEGAKSVQILNLLGQVMLVQNVNEQPNVSIAHLPNGLYLLKAQIIDEKSLINGITEGAIVSKKIVKN